MSSGPLSNNLAVSSATSADSTDLRSHGTGRLSSLLEGDPGGVAERAEDAEQKIGGDVFGVAIHDGDDARGGRDSSHEHRAMVRRSSLRRPTLRGAEGSKNSACFARNDGGECEGKIPLALVFVASPGPSRFLARAFGGPKCDYVGVATGEMRRQL